MESDDPFLVPPADKGLDAINSIDSWPSLSFGIHSDQPFHSDSDTLKAFTTLSVDVQTEIAQNPAVLTQAFHKFAISNDSQSTIEWIIDQIPLMLLRKDSYNCIPVEVAFDYKNGHAARLMLEVAHRAGLLQKLLNYRDQNNQTMLMLAVNLNSDEYSDIIDMIVTNDPSVVHKCYDYAGMNVFHVLTKSGLEVSFRIVLQSLIKLHNGPSKLNLSSMKAAIEMTDSMQNTPIHYVCDVGKVTMLDDLKEFAANSDVCINYDSHFVGNENLTPLMKGITVGLINICKWLLENGSVNVHYKQHGTCLTALHFAVKSGNVDLIRLLLDHGADAEFTDSECEDLQGYKTPMEIARDESIPNKETCLTVLKESIIVDSQAHCITTSLCLRDVTNKPSFL